MDICGAANKSMNNSYMSKSTSTSRTSMDAIVTLEDNDYEECIKTTMQVYKSRGVQCVLDHENPSDHSPKSASVKSSINSGFKLNRELDYENLSDHFPKSPAIKSSTNSGFKLNRELDNENPSDHFPKSPSVKSTINSGFKLNREQFKYYGKPSNYIHVPKVDCDSLDKWEHDMYYKLEGIKAKEVDISAASCKCEKRRDVYKPPMLRNCGVCGSTAGELPDPRAKDITTTGEPDVMNYVTQRRNTAEELPDSRASTAKDTAMTVEPVVLKYVTPRRSTAGELADPCGILIPKNTVTTVESDVMKYVTQRRNRLSGGSKSVTKEQVPKVEDGSSITTPKDVKPSILKVRKDAETDSGPKKDRHIAFDLAVDSSKVETNNKLKLEGKKKIESREEFFKSMEFVVKPYTDCIRVRHDINLFDVLDQPETPEENIPPPQSGPVENKIEKAVNEYKIKVAEKLRIQNLRKLHGTGTHPPPTSRQMTFNPMYVQPQHFFSFPPQEFTPQVPFGAPMETTYFPRVSQQYRLFKHKPNGSLVRYR